MLVGIPTTRPEPATPKTFNVIKNKADRIYSDLVGKGLGSKNHHAITRHEYEQVRPQPYSKVPLATVFPVESVTLNLGAGGLLLPVVLVMTETLRPSQSSTSRERFASSWGSDRQGQ